MADFWDSLLTSLKDPKVSSGVIGAVDTLLDPARPETKTSTYKTSLPDYIAPYVGRMLGRAEGLSQENYIPYGGQRIADFTPAQQEVFNRYGNQQVPSSVANAGGIANTAATRMLGSSYSPSQFSYSPVTSSDWNNTVAAKYMSPYMQNVTDITKREALRDYQKQIPEMAAAAARGGAFGGSRHAIIESEAQRNINQQLQDIQARGLQSAYTSGMGQFNADRTSGMNAQQSNQTAGLQTQQMGEQSKQFGAGFGLNALTGAANTAATGANIGQTQFNIQDAINKNLLGIGGMQQGLEQKSLDTGYQDFMQQKQQPYQQAQFMQGFLQGLPMTQYATAQTTPAPTMAQQLIGNTTAGYYGIGGVLGNRP